MEDKDESFEKGRSSLIREIESVLEDDEWNETHFTPQSIIDQTLVDEEENNTNDPIRNMNHIF